MIILHPDGHIERVAELPVDYECEEWKAYEAACIASEQSGVGFTDEMRELYSHYHQAMQQKAEGK